MKASGMAMVEALVAAGLLALGLLGASRLTLYALDAARQTRAQEQAQALARETLACSVARASPCPAAGVVMRQAERYTVTLDSRQLTTHLSEWAVQVDWGQDASGSTSGHSLRWRTRTSDLPDWLGVSSP